MSVMEDTYHLISSPDENSQVITGARRSKVARAVIGTSCLILLSTILTITSDNAQADDETLESGVSSGLLKLTALSSPFHSRPGSFKSKQKIPQSWTGPLKCSGSLQTRPFTSTQFQSQPLHGPGPVQAEYSIDPITGKMTPKKEGEPKRGRVVVIGCAGRTGRLAFEQLLKAGYDTRGIMRAEGKYALEKGGKYFPRLDEYVKDVSASLECDPIRIRSRIGIATILNEGELDGNLFGADAIVVLTSAVPKKIGEQEGRPIFGWGDDYGTPELVDYVGVQNIIKAAQKASVRRVVLVGSMGGTQPDNMLNKIADGNILVWKRRAEMALMSSGLEYTIIHPGGLIDEEGGKRELLIDVDDKLLSLETRSIPRADVAAMVVNCIDCPEAKNRAFDLASRPEGEGSGPTKDFCALVGSLGSATCDYGLNTPPALEQEPIKPWIVR
eukprot:gnl/MRDRNA2_/MRDRNA2_101770_c0_seq1.p1 gnl/MRDRNA2_/MRDRNA2_101770_c0~~gnl/MRDRNA2_/MRDRNA2_101770_c0_seq1.p1  ORF type:complete len:442 (-),score=75.60 gnl/MRDRNA2_/MRDRNA2_101770_c0_seq1:34-1359(-)